MVACDKIPQHLPCLLQYAALHLLQMPLPCTDNPADHICPVYALTVQKALPCRFFSTPEIHQRERERRRADIQRHTVSRLAVRSADRTSGSCQAAACRFLYLHRQVFGHGGAAGNHVSVLFSLCLTGKNTDTAFPAPAGPAARRRDMIPVSLQYRKKVFPACAVQYAFTRSCIYPYFHDFPRFQAARACLYCVLLDTGTVSTASTIPSAL